MPRRLKDHEAVILLDDHQEYGLRAGDVGAIGTVYERHDAYDAESAKADRRPIAILTLDAAGIRPLSGKRQIAPTLDRLPR